MKRTDLERAVDGMEAAGWRWAGMSSDKTFFDRKTRDAKTGKCSVEWKEFSSAAEIEKFLGKKRKRNRKRI